MDTPVCNTSDIVACVKIRAEDSKHYYYPHAFELTYRGAKKQKDKDVEKVSSIKVGEKASSTMHSSEVQPQPTASPSPQKHVASEVIPDNMVEGTCCWII